MEVPIPYRDKTVLAGGRIQEEAEIQRAAECHVLFHEKRANHGSQLWNVRRSP
jgi:hypothetical protein